MFTWRWGVIKQCLKTLQMFTVDYCGRYGVLTTVILLLDITWRHREACIQRQEITIYDSVNYKASHLPLQQQQQQQQQRLHYSSRWYKAKLAQPNPIRQQRPRPLPSINRPADGHRGRRRVGLQTFDTAYARVAPRLKKTVMMDGNGGEIVAGKVKLQVGGVRSHAERRTWHRRSISRYCSGGTGIK